MVMVGMAERGAKMYWWWNKARFAEGPVAKAQHASSKQRALVSNSIWGAIPYICLHDQDHVGVNFDKQKYSTLVQDGLHRPPLQGRDAGYQICFQDWPTTSRC